MLTLKATLWTECRVILIRTLMADPPSGQGRSRGEPSCRFIVPARVAVAAIARRGHIGLSSWHGAMVDRCCRGRGAAQPTTGPWRRNFSVLFASGTH
jgi:hypothetical protein